MASRDELILGSDMLIELCNLRDAETNQLVTGATVTGQVLDSAGAPVSGVPDPIIFIEVVGRQGLYRGTIPAAAGYVNGDEVTVQVTAVSVGGQTRIFTIRADVIVVS